MKSTPTPSTLYLFAGSNGAGKTTFARAYLRQLNPLPRFLNADEIARGLSPLDPGKLAIKAIFSKSTPHSQTAGRSETTASSLLPCFSTLQTPLFSKSKTSYANETIQARQSPHGAARIHCPRPSRRQSHGQGTPCRAQTLEPPPALLERRQSRCYEAVKPEDRYHRLAKPELASVQHFSLLEK
ncbi:MAG: hypothetical protein ABI162_14965 [Luteolibacter sp.]